MKVRIKFAKYGAMKFIGHLDVMRYFQKAMRRADIDIAFTEGFSPHMVMSFALPLGVGVASDGEYMDIEIRTPVSSAEAVARLNAVMAEGMRILSFREIPEGRANNAMTLVCAARYLIRPAEETAFLPTQSDLERFLGQERIVAAKKSKSGEREEDIRPLIYQMNLTDANEMDLVLAAGSAANLKPELLMEALAVFAGREMPAYRVHRLELYTRSDDRLIPLEELGREIEA